jgi:hypothetical protein
MAEKEILFLLRRSHAVAGNAITSACFVAIGAKVTRCACAMLCSRRKWPYIFIASAPPSLWPSQLETVGIVINGPCHRR